MALLNINLLQQQQTRLSRLNQANVIVAIVAGTIIALQLLVVAFLYATIKLRDVEKDGINNEAASFSTKTGEINKYDSSFYPDLSLTDQAKLFQEQVSLATNLVDNHKYFSLYVSEVAINTPDTIRYQSFSIDSGNRLSIVGRARDYVDVSRLAESFSKLSFGKGANIQDAKLDPSDATRKIKFTMSIDLKSAAELKKLPAPSGERQQSTPSSPQPSAKPTASASPGTSR